MKSFARTGTLCRAALMALALGASGAAFAQFDLTATGGAATHEGVSKYGLIGGYTQPAPLMQLGSWNLQLRHEVELSYWHVPHARDIVEFGYSPFLRLEHPFDQGQSNFFVEASIGARLLSHHRLGPNYNMSTAFQFSDQVGAGVQWGASTVGARFQHLSNAGIKSPNPGINFVNVYYRYRF